VEMKSVTFFILNTRRPDPLLTSPDLRFASVWRRRRTSVKHNSGTITFRCLFSMERLFSPCSRLHDLIVSQGGQEEDLRSHGELLQELNLNVSTDELLSAERAFTYADFYAMLGNPNTIAWLTPHAGIAREDGRARRYWLQLDESCHFRFTVDGKDIVAFARSSEQLLEICDIVLRLLAVSVVQSLRVNDHTTIADLFIDSPTLAYLMEQCQSLKVLSLFDLETDEDHCRVLGAFSRPGLDIALINCQLTSAGASALAQVLGRNQGPTKLNRCDIDNSVFADGLRGNSRMKVFRALISDSRDAGNRELLAIADALRENKGLVDLDLVQAFTMSDETWDTVCDSLKTHSTLQVLCLRSNPMLPLADLKPCVRSLVDMMKVNTSVHTIHLDYRYSQQFLISRRTGSGCAFLPSKKHARSRTVPRCWDERFLLYERIPIHFGCFYQGMPKLSFRRRPLRLRVSQRLLM
jgi:hypothetical protein